MCLFSRKGLCALHESYFCGDPSRAIAVMRQGQGAGFSLPTHLSKSIGYQLGFNFEKVRIHTDGNAALAARRLGANAFAIEDDVFFASEQYDPNSSRGLRLLSHELAHVVQQSKLAKGIAASEAELEWEAMCASANTFAAPIALRAAEPAILREPTLPRRCTADALVCETERILALNRDPGSGDETTQMWSRVGSNFGASSIGTVARRVWTYMFLRHFVDSDSAPGVESVFPRYFFSRKYGWIDGQHFFGFIDYAEGQHQANSDDNAAFAAATKQGVDIEKDQQKVRDWVIQGAPRDPGKFGLMQVNPPNTALFRVPQMTVGGLAAHAASVFGSVTLTGTQGELFSQLNEDRRRKFFLDSAKVSVQLRRHPVESTRHCVLFPL